MLTLIRSRKYVRKTSTITIYKINVPTIFKLNFKAPIDQHDMYKNQRLKNDYDYKNQVIIITLDEIVQIIGHTVHEILSTPLDQSYLNIYHDIDYPKMHKLHRDQQNNAMLIKINLFKNP